ncbi:hypothetical protein D6D01_08969 [Aureobasidium pullulans]|uniref:Uncharacterized protein n=1 Tax=Aureobasidium pullulans TaxID=5580 RepID=A0A4S9K792_AURPU|nr:hypothetical protein D6D01_08969 [Aureobasidium pullulans]
MLNNILKSLERASDRTRPSPSRSDSFDRDTRLADERPWTRYQSSPSRQSLDYDAEHRRYSPNHPESSAASSDRGHSNLSRSFSSSVDSEESPPSSMERLFDMYPSMLAILCSDSIRGLFETLRRRRAKKRNSVEMETLITIGVLQKDFEQWEDLLGKAGAAKLPGLAQDKPDPFKVSMMLSLLQLCAHLEQAESHLNGPDTSSKWQHAHNAIDYCCGLGQDTEDLWCSEDESDDNDSNLRIRSNESLQPLARSLAHHGFPMASDEDSFDASLDDILRCRSSLENFVPGLELRIYMSDLESDISSSDPVYEKSPSFAWVRRRAKKSVEAGRKGMSKDRAFLPSNARY